MAEFDRATAREEIRELIHDVLKKKKSKVGLDEIVEGTSLVGQLGIDSLDILQLSSIIEKKYSLKIPEDEMTKFDDIGNILDSVEKHWPKG